ncbi:MAG: sulfatase [Bacteroidota bacterium]
MIARPPIYLLLIAFILSCAPEKKPESKAPNVLFIAIDDLNDWLGCMNGHPNTITPNMDELASKGVLFTNAYCQAPLCGPSRASIMTGLRPSTTGIYGMIDDNDIRSVLPDITFLPEYFKQNGYYTMGIGKLFHQHAPDSVFDESGGRTGGFGPRPEERFVWDGYGTADREVYGRTSTDWGAYPEVDSLMIDYQSADWAIERLGKDYDDPFFMAVGFIRPHVPWYAPQKWFDMHPLEGLAMTPYKADDLDDIPEVGKMINDLPMMPTTDWAIESGNWDDMIQAYLGCITFVDAQVGRVIEALENSPYADNTIIVLWSDHGYRMGEKGTFAKHALWEEATNAPLIFSAPSLPEGKVISQPVEMLSIYPTLLELSGLQANEKNEGISLVELMKSEGMPTDYAAITTYGMNNHAIRTPQYRYIQYEDGTSELYDHTSDPNEWTNVSGSPDLSEVKQRLSGLLPKRNVKWVEPSNYTLQPYFVEQKARNRQ